MKQPDNIILELISYNREHFDRYSDLPIRDLFKKMNTDKVNWINVDVLSDVSILEALQSHFNLHALIVEDIMNDQRPKAEEFDDYVFFTLKMLYRIQGSQIDYEQISFVLGANFLLSFQEKEGDLFDSFRERIRLSQGRVRDRRADYLLYRLTDIIVDHYYVILENIGNVIEEIEDIIYDNPTNHTFHRIQQLKKDLIYLRKTVIPLREALSTLMKDEGGFIEEDTLPFFQDIYDHIIHLTESIDTYNDLTTGLVDLYFNTQNSRLNEVIKVLTVISTIFIPLTFIAGVYGMNFRFMPELDWRWGYFTVWGIMILITVAMLFYFKFKKWF